MKRGLYIGRFQPLHYGHLSSLQWCINRVDELIIAVGSSDKSFEKKNPFTAGERIEMIRNTIVKEMDEKMLQRIILIPVPDIGIHQLWTYNTDILVPKYNVVFTNDHFTSMLYKERNVEVIKPELIKRDHLSATEVRYRISCDKNWQELVSDKTAESIMEMNGIERIKSLYKSTSPSLHDH